MSRIGKMPIRIPEGVKLNTEDHIINVSGPGGNIIVKLKPEIGIEINNNEAKIVIKNKNKQVFSIFGTSRTLIQNAIIGVTEGFEKKLEIHGVGYKASLKEKDLFLELGYSHPVIVNCPEGIEFKIQKNIIIVSGAKKEQVGEMASRIRHLRKVEPYKGKGIRYSEEIIRKKIGKKAKAALGESSAVAK
jgi:large subunit ribosomal protein L6